MSTEASGPIASVVIPAHNEATVIARCLRAILDGAQPHEFEIVVAANGCSDQTVDVARRAAPTATVLDLPQASKVAALNAGDAAANTFPRAYVDADVEVDATSLRACVSVLGDPGIECVAPQLHLHVDGRPWWIRRFYDCFARLPYLADDLVGQGFYMLSQRGRGRFDVFPDITADDLFVRNLFPRGQRRAVPAGTFHVHTPRTLRGLLAVRRRTYRGNAEYLRAGFTSDAEYTDDATRLAQQLREQPVSFVVYATTNAVARLQLRLQGEPAAWERDDSSR